jgi:hypothetical protein
MLASSAVVKITQRCPRLLGITVISVLVNGAFRAIAKYVQARWVQNTCFALKLLSRCRTQWHGSVSAGDKLVAAGDLEELAQLLSNEDEDED